MPAVPDLPATILDAIAADPGNGNRWMDLSAWLWTEGRDDEALTVRVLWPTLRDNLACTSLAATLADVARNAKVLAAVAREVERPEDETPAV